jgi:hypothetical protein
MNGFYANRRERFLNESSYEDFRKNFMGLVAECHDLLKHRGPSLESDDGRHIDWRWGIASSRFQLLIGRYSAGDPVASMAGGVPQVLANIEASALAHDYRTEPFYLDEIDTYAYAMWLLSLCKLLRLDPLLPRVIALFDVAREDNRGRDALFEALVGKLGGDSVPVKPAKAMLKMLKAHPILFQAIEAEPKKRPLLVAEFLKKWYPSMKGCYWYGLHEKLPQNFFGYWAFEAGLVTYLWDIDDSGYRDLPFYPKDLVDYARAHPDVDAAALALESKPVDLDNRPPSVPAGQTCTRSGYWFTPAQADSRRRFTQGEVMPSLGGDYGLTIWQWDDNQRD